jgi:nicotinamidase-related amidase
VKEFQGVEMLTVLDEVVDPAHTALLIAGIQNDTCAPGGVLAKRGRDLKPFRRIIVAIDAVLREARAHGIPVIYVQNYVSPGTTLSGPWLEYLFGHLEFPSHAKQLFNVAGTWGVETVDELAPSSGEVIVMAPRSSAFFQTNLDQILRCQGIKSLVCAGASTEGSIDSTVRDALLNDYYAVVLEDCVTSDRDDLGEAALTLLRSRTDVARSNEVVEIWRDRSFGSPRADARLSERG